MKAFGVMCVEPSAIRERGAVPRRAAVEADGTPPEQGDPATGWEAVGINYDTDDEQIMAVHAQCVTP